MDQIDAVEVFWRPGCFFCARLEHSLTKANVPITKRNIWEDEDAAALVRAAADDNETVPTVRIGDRWIVNPDPRELAKLLENEASHLLGDV